MSYIYTKEPPTNGKVLVKTTLGDLDIELWSKEAPLACKNFVQLCLEGYYDGTIFHRIVKDFITQGGDPTGTGEGGESVYGHPFKDEFHSRLKFLRRGLVGSANAGANDNSSQFFITLGRTDELINKHTLFGKVTGDTLYNLVQFNEIPTDQDDRPLDSAPRIVRTEVLQNPFDDIVPRVDPKKALERREEKITSQSKATKNFSLLSFGEEAEEDEEETVSASKDLKIRSSHDVLKEDPKLSSQPALDPENMRDEDMELQEDLMGEGEGEDGRSTEVEREREEYTREREKRLRMMEEQWEDEDTRRRKRREKLQQESQELCDELKKNAKRRKGEKEAIEKAEEDKWKDLPEPVRALREEQEVYRKRKKALGKGGAREQQTIELLSKFKGKMMSAQHEGQTDPSNSGEEGEKEGEGGGGGKKGERGKEAEDEGNWLKHKLEFTDERAVVTKDASIQNEDSFDIYDPRNPLNKRRREENKKEKETRHGRDERQRDRRDRTRR